jgi:very long chain acyl-CoA dehydrogenase
LVRFTSTGNTKSAAAQPKVASKPSREKPVESTSFAMNLFRGQLRLEEVFPFPNTLNDEQRETLQALVDPTAKFFEV